MKIEKNIIDKKDENEYRKATKKSLWFLNKKIIQSFVKLKLHDAIRYYERIKSLKKNIKARHYPRTFVEQRKKIAIYTALYGDYDTVKKIKIRNPLCDYFIFTDQKFDESTGWEKKDFNFPISIIDDNVSKNRYLKMHPHVLFPEYEYSIYLDSVFTIELDIYRLLGRIGDKIMGLFKHSQNRCDLYGEAEVLKRIGKVSKEEIDSLMNRYKQEGFPENYGFFECCVIVRKHNEEICRKIMESWWNEFSSGPKRDQLSFMYCLWKNNLTSTDVACLGATYVDEAVLNHTEHKKTCSSTPHKCTEKSKFY